MKVSILNVGKVRQDFIIQGEREYLKRLSSSLKVDLLELGVDSPDSLGAEQAREREASEITRKLAGYDYIVALDERGKLVTSKEFSTLIQGRMNAGTKHVCFLIGGAFGLSEKVRQSAHYILSLSSLTFPHQLTRLILIEQIYRAQTLMQGVGIRRMERKTYRDEGFEVVD